MIVIDTNVASELMRPSPAVAVRDWVRSQDGRDLCTTAITVAEILYGIERLPSGRHKQALKAAVAEVFGMFVEQILPFDAAAAEQYAQMVSYCDGLGLPVDGFDAQIAAICRGRGAALATRNLEDQSLAGPRG
ncbi:MAG: type II toxin-antitoxin system VapC family toxin [Micromonosporaceae bacterium]